MTMFRSRRWSDDLCPSTLWRAALLALVALPLVACGPTRGCGSPYARGPAYDDSIPTDPDGDADAPKPPTDPWDPDGAAPSMSYMDLVFLIESRMADDFDGMLARALEYLAGRYAAEGFYVGVEPGWNGYGPGFWIDPYVTEPFVGDDFETDPEGMYTVVEFAVVDEHCGVTGITPADVDEQGDQPQRWEGICAPLSVLHSLVDQMHVIGEDWEGVVDGDNWDPDLVRAVITEGGGDPDEREERAFSASEGDYNDAHEADWNEDFEIVSKTGGEWIDEARDDCEALEEWCERMEQLVEEDNDDCVLRVDGATLDGRDVGHAMVVYNSHGADEHTSVQFAETATSCYCEIKVVDTAIQDTDGDCVVPRNPGHQLWRIYPDDIVVVAADNRNAAFFTGLRFANAAFQCWDEDPKEGVGEDDPGRPGDAMPTD